MKLLSPADRPVEAGRKLAVETSEMAAKSLDAISPEDIAALGIPSEVAEKLHQTLLRIIAGSGAATAETWSRISKELLTPDLPYSLHQMMYYGCYSQFGSDPPAWLPDL